MSTLLRLDASARISGSVSRLVADAFVQSWQAKHRANRVVHRDLAKAPVQHIEDRTIQGFYTPTAQLTDELRTALVQSDELIGELFAADHLLIATPMYNFSVPSSLKAWIDQIVRINKTFQYDGSGFTGLVTGRRATVIVAYGASGYQVGGGYRGANFVDPYLSFLLTFLGFKDVEVVPIEATTAGAETVAANREAAIVKARQLAALA